MMKVALIVEQFRSRHGGAERAVVEMGSALAAAGADVTLAAANLDTDPSEKLPFKTQKITVKGSSKSGRWIFFQRTCCDQLKQCGFDILHSLVPLRGADLYQPRGGSLLYSTRRHACSYSSQWIRTYKRLAAPLNQARQLRIAAERAICQDHSGPVIAALSRYVADQFRREYQVPDERIRVIPNAVDTAPLRHPKARAQGMKLRKLYDPHDNRTLFLFAAENLRLKGLSWLIQAAALAKQNKAPADRDFRIFVVSAGHFGKYWRQARRRNLSGDILFMGATTHMAGLLHMCDAVVLPTYNDACSRVVMESLAVGRPAITTVYNGAAEFLTRPEYGLVLDRQDDIEGLGLALAQFCRQGKTPHMSQVINQDHLHRKLDMKRHAGELLDLYESLRNPEKTP